MLAGVAVTLLAALAAVVFAWPDGVDDRRLVDDVVALQARVDAADRATLRGRVVPESGFAGRVRAAGWRPVAIHDQRAHGRMVTTVVWERGGRRAVHSVLAGRPLGRPEGSGRTGRGGMLLYGMDEDLRTVVTWTEDGATSVASAAELPLGDLYDLAGGPAAR